MNESRKVDPRDFITPPFTTCPKCSLRSFGILRVGPDNFLRRCRECYHMEAFDLPRVHKAIVYLDQFVISNLMLVRSGIKQVHPFYHALYNKLLNLSNLQAVVCPHSEAHSIESIVSAEHRQLRSGFEMFAHSVRFEEFDLIRAHQVFDRLAKWLARDSSQTCAISRNDVLRGGRPDVWVDRITVSVDMPPIPGLVDKLRDWRGKSHRGLVKVFEDTWKKQPERTWEYWRDREAGCWGPGLIPIFKREIAKWDDIINGRRQPEGPHEMQPHHYVTLILDTASTIESAGCPKEEKIRMAFEFLHSDTLAHSPFRQIAGSLYASLAKKATSQVKPPTEGFHNDVDVMSCLLPYCDAMFMDREIAAYWREIQGSPTHRLPFETRVFSLATTTEFFAYLDHLACEVPAEQRRLVAEVYA